MFGEEKNVAERFLRVSIVVLFVFAGFVLMTRFGLSFDSNLCQDESMLVVVNFITFLSFSGSLLFGLILCWVFFFLQKNKVMKSHERKCLWPVISMILAVVSAVMIFLLSDSRSGSSFGPSFAFLSYLLIWIAVVFLNLAANVFLFTLKQNTTLLGVVSLTASHLVVFIPFSWFIFGN